MECLLRGNPKACINYCNEIVEHKWDETKEKVWKCYQNKGVPENYYGREKCEDAYPKKYYYDANYQCMV